MSTSESASPSTSSFSHTPTSTLINTQPASSTTPSTITMTPATSITTSSSSSSSSCSPPPSSSSSSSSSTTTTTSSSSSSSSTVVLLIMGMAGSGKTSLLHRLSVHCASTGIGTYVMNLDPAVHHLPYQPNIDIRDTVNYKQVQRQYGLGPNGAILTSLNLFATRFDQVLHMLEQRFPTPSSSSSSTASISSSSSSSSSSTTTTTTTSSSSSSSPSSASSSSSSSTSSGSTSSPSNTGPTQVILVDTPGQLEVFTWSASGVIVSESLSATFPTVCLYVLDTPRNVQPSTFISNMLYATSILYKSRLPFLLLFNKIDVMRHETIQRWMTDIDDFNQALKSDDSYMSSLSRSMGLLLNEFYSTIKTVGVSAVTGEGMTRLFEHIQTSHSLYFKEYVPYLEAIRQNRARQIEADKLKMKKKLEKDLQQSKGQTLVLDMNKQKQTHVQSRPPHSQLRHPPHQQQQRNDDHDDDEEEEEPDDDDDGGRHDEDEEEEEDGEENGEEDDEDGARDPNAYENEVEEAADRAEYESLVHRLHSLNPAKPKS